MVRAAIDGVYADPFFESFPGQQDAFDRRLRANIQKILRIYSGNMCDNGHALEIVEDDQVPTRRLPKYIMRSSYLELVKKLMEECRGRELPGTYNPLVVGDLFSRQCKPWEQITQNLAELVHGAASTTFHKILTVVCDENTSRRLMKGIIQPSLYNLRKKLKDKLDELLAPHLSIHPITYNDYLLETVQTEQGNRHDRKFERLVTSAFDDFLESGGDVTLTAAELEAALQEVKDGTRPDVEEYTVSLCADVAEAYYEVMTHSARPLKSC